MPKVRSSTTPIPRLDDLIPDLQNANLGTARGREALAQSLREFGPGRAVLIDRHGNIIAGNKTVEEAKRLNIPLQVVKTDGNVLVAVQREDLDLTGTKHGCELGECGACAVLIDGVAARSCVIPISGCVGRDIVTLEGLGSRDHPDPVQDAFIREQAAQCGYCLNGMIMTTKALLMRTPHPSEADVLEALRYNLCRCGAHIEIVRAAMRAAGLVAEVQG